MKERGGLYTYIYIINSGSVSLSGIYKGKVWKSYLINPEDSVVEKIILLFNKNLILHERNANLIKNVK